MSKNRRKNHKIPWKQKVSKGFCFVFFLFQDTFLYILKAIFGGNIFASYFSPVRTGWFGLKLSKYLDFFAFQISYFNGWIALATLVQMVGIQLLQEPSSVFMNSINPFVRVIAIWENCWIMLSIDIYRRNVIKRIQDVLTWHIQKVTYIEQL